MAATALDVLSLAAAKAELQVEDTDAFNARIEAEIGAAVDFVSRELGRPLLDLTEIYECPPPAAGATYPLRIEATDATGVDHINFWTLDGELRSAPEGHILDSDLGRVLLADEQVEVWPPAAGWPDALGGSDLEVYITRAFDTEAHPSVRHAVICATRNFYNGATEIMTRNAVFHLLRPWRRLARTGVSTTRRRPTHGVSVSGWSPGFSDGFGS